MLRVGLTGGFGAGKTTIASWLRQAGIPVLDADVVAHQLLAAGGAGVAPVQAAFGAAVLAPDGGVDRKALAALVFPNPSARKQLEMILHPRIIAAGNQWLDQMEQHGHPVAVIEAALIFEAESASRFDRIIAVTCPPEIKIARWQQRGGSAEEAEARLAAQLPDAQKARRADWVLDNSGSLAATRAEFDRLLAELHHHANSAAPSPPG
ncbi:MAG: dephospho-CoA kinase [Terriglobales bacterium]